ncbi:TetR/AcrR family transcriptional regulator [Streptomyces sp. NBC_00654]|uniref:TetR/AcrR family transcriptional regulator n=1 Tax=Streptomyces sp. NBC_00654 TaxID=2975799 RepID=UPI00225641A7|nr:TetR/AcrR family transcriptional regulator [Streptomyces sp. NBC_00654]MCX4966047.1 TetR/AcrR family transcriptional regulator [Streptomyces sp. NBC_00654]
MLPAASARGTGGRSAPYTVETLLAVSVEVFNERGYDGTTMDDVARAAGISKSSLYHHVRGKEELLERAVRRALEELFRVFDDAEAQRGPAVLRLEYVAHRVVRMLVAELPYVTLLLRLRGNTGAERAALARRREFDRRVTGLVERAVADGDLSDAVEPRLATRLLFGMINSVVDWYRPHIAAAGPAAVTGRELADAVVRLAFQGLRHT